MWCSRTSHTNCLTLFEIVNPTSNKQTNVWTVKQICKKPDSVSTRVLMSSFSCKKLGEIPKRDWPIAAAFADVKARRSEHI